MGAIIMAPFEVWQLRSAANGGHRLLSTSQTKAAQEREMTHWDKELPDACLIYRTRQTDGSVIDELHLDRTLNSIKWRATPWPG